MFFKSKRTEKLNEVRSREAMEEAIFQQFFSETFVKADQAYYVDDSDLYLRYLRWLRINEKEGARSYDKLAKYLKEKEKLQSLKWGKENDLIWLGLRYKEPKAPIHHLCKGRYLKYEDEPLPKQAKTDMIQYSRFA